MQKQVFVKIVIGYAFFLLLLSLVGWYFTKKLLDAEAYRNFNYDVDLVERWITNRLEVYRTLAYGFKALVTQNNNLTQKYWEDFTKNLEIEERFTGINSIAFLEKKENGYFIKFIYPPEKGFIIGTNVYDFPDRAAAIERAIETKDISFTQRVTLLATQKPGFVMFIPVFDKGGEKVKGLIGMTFQSEKIFKDLFDETDPFPHLDFELFKGNALEERNLLYDHDKNVIITKEKEQKFQTKRKIVINNETLTLIVKKKKDRQTKKAEFIFLFPILHWDSFEKLDIDLLKDINTK